MFFKKKIKLSKTFLEILQEGGFSVAHGAGRKWARNKALEYGKNKDKKGISLTITELGSHVIAEDKDLLYEELPEAYKEIKDIIADLQNAGLIKVIAVFRPLITYKMRVKRYDN